MNTINSNVARVGNATSSEIVALTKFGRKEGSIGESFYTYIEECNMERRLGRSLTDESNARPLAWGSLVERIAFNTLDTEYSLNSSETVVHPTIDYWAGSADCFKEDIGRTVADIKCPMTLKSFCQLVDPAYKEGKLIYPACSIEAVRYNHKDGEKFYWQLVSNATIHNCRSAELIVYMPYQRELQAIRELAQDAEPKDLYKYFWIANGNDEELPHLVEGGHYENRYIIRFDVPQADKDFLTERVKLAGTFLQDFHTI